MENTRMTVPCKTESHSGVDRKQAEIAQHAWVGGTSEALLTLSEALASLVAEALKVRAAKGLSWAGIIVTVFWNESKGCCDKRQKLPNNSHSDASDILKGKAKTPW